MKAARLEVLACPSCGGAVPAAASCAFLPCPSCGSPLAVRAPDGVVRRAVLPALGEREALAAARRCWEGPMVPEGFSMRSLVEAPRLAFLAFYEVERTLEREGSARRVLLETLDRAPAVSLPGFRIEALDPHAIEGSIEPIPFDPAALQRRGLVFDPSRSVGEAVPVDPAVKLLEERVAVVYLPVWFVRCRYGRNLYEVAVDGATGAVLRARAPAVRDLRLPQAIAAVYLLAFASAFFFKAGLTTLLLLLKLREVGAIGGLFLLAGLAWLLAWAWDRIRFRYEVVIEGDARKLVAINRPERTAPEKVRDGLIALAGQLLERSAGRRT